MVRAVVTPMAAITSGKRGACATRTARTRALDPHYNIVFKNKRARETRESQRELEETKGNLRKHKQAKHDNEHDNNRNSASKQNEKRKTTKAKTSKASGNHRRPEETRESQIEQEGTRGNHRRPLDP